jgi:hypothetical protein
MVDAFFPRREKLTSGLGVALTLTALIEKYADSGSALKAGAMEAELPAQLDVFAQELPPFVELAAYAPQLVLDRAAHPLTSFAAIWQAALTAGRALPAADFCPWAA